MSFEFDTPDVGRRDLSELWTSKIPEDAHHIVVHLRKADDILALMDENVRLKKDIDRLKQDLYSSSLAHVKYLECLDELKEIRSFMKRSGISWRFRTI